jgi:Phage tail protein (Tail_P2_I)
MDRPDYGGFADAVYDQMAPVAIWDADYDWPLLKYLGAVGQMLELLDSLAHDDIAWSGMLDLDRVPSNALPWLAQFLGVVLDVSLPDDEQRQQIRTHIGWSRGTPATFKMLAAQKLTGTRTVELHERDTSAYHFTVVTYQDETPPDDWPVTNLISNPSFETNTTGWFVA